MRSPSKQSESDSVEGYGHNTHILSLNQEHRDLLVSLIKDQQVVDVLGPAEAIIPLAHKYAEGSDSPAWRKKFINKKAYSRNIDIVESENSVSLSDHSEDEMPGESGDEES